jgi:hypothetical protein
MTLHEDEFERDVSEVFSAECSVDMVDRAMDDDRDEPDNFIRMLLAVLDCTRDSRAQEALYRLIEAAYDCSIIKDAALDEYLDKLRSGGKPTAEFKEGRRKETKAETTPDNTVAVRRDESQPRVIDVDLSGEEATPVEVRLRHDGWRGEARICFSVTDNRAG